MKRLSFVSANKMVGLAAMLLFALLGSGCFRSTPSALASHGTLERMLQEKKLTVTYIDYPPAVFRDPQTGQMKGLFVDTLDEILRQVDPGIKVTYEETTWADFGTELNTHRADLSIAGTFATVPRAKVVAFTTPIVYLGRSALVRKGDTRFSPDRGPSQFDRPDVKVAVVAGEGSHEYVKQNFKSMKNVLVFSGSDLSQCLQAVLAGQVDVGMSDALETSKFVRAHPDQITDLYADNPYDLNPISWAVRQDDLVWKSFLDTSLNTLETQGKILNFEKRYDFQWSHKALTFSRSGLTPR